MNIEPPGIRPFTVKLMNKVAMSSLSAAGSKKLPIIDCWFGKVRAIYPSICKYFNIFFIKFKSCKNLKNKHI